MASADHYPGSEADEESMEALLSVPLDLFVPVENPAQNTRTPTKQRFLRKEAWELLRVRLLASEMDCLLSLSTSILMQLSSRRQSIRSLLKICGSTYGSEEILLPLEREHLNSNEQKADSYTNGGNQEQLDQSPSIPISISLRAVLPLLIIHGENYCNDQLTYIQQQMSNCLKQLHECSEIILQFSEQNLAVADQLIQAAQNEEEYGDGHSAAVSHTCILAQEKRFVGEIEEAVCTRIEHVLNMASFRNGIVEQKKEHEESEHDVDAFELATEKETGTFLSMERLCQQLQNEISSLSPSNGNNDDQKSGAAMGLTSLSSMKRRRQSDNTSCASGDSEYEGAKRNKVAGSDNDSSKAAGEDVTSSQVNAATLLSQFSRIV